MKLVILESRAKAKTVKKYLGKGWMVEACNGHVQDLPSNGASKESSKALWASKPGELPNPPWMWTGRAEGVVSKILSKAAKSGVDEVFIATDPDREGEFIAWRLSIIFSDFKSVHRISFNEITKSAISEAIGNPRGLDSHLVEAAMVRRFMDRLVGFRCSKFCRSWKLRSMGRVQTPTLGFIVEREVEREAHVPKEYHTVLAQSNGIQLKVRFHNNDDPNVWTDNKGKRHYDRTSNTELASQAYELLLTSEHLTLSAVDEKTDVRSPKPPFTTETMLRTANSTYGWSLAKTSNIASSLYQAGHITYIRTDSTRTNANARSEIRKYISEKFGQDHLGDGVGESTKKSTTKIQDAHEAIRPTNPLVSNIESDKDEMKLYSLIWSRFAASQMSKSIRERRNIILSCAGLDLEIFGTCNWRTHSGWETVFTGISAEPETEPPSCGFNIGSPWHHDNVPELITDFTKPPSRLTENSIIKLMKQAGIGRPSTYVSTITKLVDRSYIDKDGSSLIPTINGRTLWLDVAPFYNETTLLENGLFTPEFTSLMEDSLDKIEVGTIDSSQTWEEFVDSFREMHNKALDKRRETPTIRQKEYLENLLSRLEEEEKAKFLSGKTIEDLTGSEIKLVIDRLSESDLGVSSASKKQIGYIISLVDRLDLKLSDILKDRGISDVSDLTGGREGSASELIGELKTMDDALPATEKQITTIHSMADQMDISVEQAIEMANVISIDLIGKSDASTLISLMKKQITSKRKTK